MNKLSRLVAGLLVAVMAAGLLPIVAFAYGDGDPVDFKDNIALEAAIKDWLEKETITYGEAKEVDELFLEGWGISSLDGLEYFENLTTLDLTSNKVTDLTPLADLTKLTDLTLWDNKITDLTPLTGLTELNNLILWDNKITDILPLAALVNLEYLDLDTNYIRNISPLENLTKLETIYLFNNPIDTSAGSASMEVIEALKWQGTNVHYDEVDEPYIWINRSSSYIDIGDTFDILAHTMGLSSAEIAWSNSNPSVAALSGRKVTALSDGETTLTAASVADPTVTATYRVVVMTTAELNEVVTFTDEALKDVVKRKLGIFMGNVTLRDVVNVERFSIGSEGISDITGLEKFYSLKNLYLAENEISDISPLADLTNLRDLDLSYNKIADITPLSSLGMLKYLNLSGNSIYNISSLKNSSRLYPYSYINLEYNGLDLEDSEVAEMIKYIENSLSEPEHTDFLYKRQDKKIYFEISTLYSADMDNFDGWDEIWVDINNQTPGQEPGWGTIIVNKYDGKGKLIDSHIEDAWIPPYGVISYAATVDVSDENIAEMKIMLWDSVEGLLPLADYRVVER